MNKKNLYVGMGLGMAALGATVLAARPRKKHKMRKAMGRALKTMGDVADSISDSMGW